MKHRIQPYVKSENLAKLSLIKLNHGFDNDSDCINYVFNTWEDKSPQKSGKIKFMVDRVYGSLIPLLCGYLAAKYESVIFVIPAIFVMLIEYDYVKAILKV